MSRLRGIQLQARVWPLFGGALGACTVPSSVRQRMLVCHQVLYLSPRGKVIHESVRTSGA